MNRLIVAAVLLAIGSVVITPAAEALEPLLAAGAVLALAAAGFWMIVRAPFDRF